MPHIIEGIAYESLPGEPVFQVTQIPVQQLGIGKFIHVRKEK
jgi:hypothetical protein